MFTRIKNLIVAAGMFSMIAAPFAVSTAVYADIAGQVCKGVKAANGDGTSLDIGTTGENCDEEGNGNSVQNILNLVVNIFSIIVGFIAVIMIIYGGVKYITSGGESSNISSAKSTIIYALIGLVIVALAQVLVRFVLSKASGVTGGTN